MAIRTRDPRTIVPAELAVGAEVDVWTIPAAAPEASVTAAMNLLSPAERTRAEGFRHPPAQRNFIIARAALRQILARQLQVAPSEIAFQNGPHGKPALAGIHAGRLFFNLSHSADLALVAVAHGAEVGIDVEKLRPMPDALQIAERFFAPQESAPLKQLPKAELAVAFFNLWTRKEALAKATGLGIAYSLARFEVSSGAEARVFSIDGDVRQAAQWSLHAFEPAPGYVAAVAVSSANARFSLHEFRTET